MGKINRRTIPDETWRKARKIGQEQEVNQIQTHKL